jgi:hypothetical protein
MTTELNKTNCKGQLIPDTAAELVAAWDKGELPIWTVAMGGLGPGYEQALQTLMIELLRSAGPLPKDDAPEQDFRHWGSDVIGRHSTSLGGLSGAQVGAAKGLAAAVIRRGMHAVLDEVDSERRTQISKFWPRAKEG